MADTFTYPGILNLEIKKASIEDAQWVLFFIKEIAEYEKLADQVIAKEEDVKNLFFCKNPKVFCIIASLDNVPVGFAVYFYNFSTFLCKHGLYLEDLFILTDHRGEGIGKALMLYLTKIALQNHCGRMEWSVLNWNTPAIEFYKSLQANPMDEWTIFRLTELELKALN